MDTTYQKAFAFFMDCIVYPVAWVLSPNLRKHQRAVKLQNAHLDGELHVVPDLSCWYCVARENDRRNRNIDPEERP